MQAFHNKLEEKKWCGLSLEEQMGNIASEVYRIWSRRKAGDSSASNMAFGRALELIDLTMAGGLLAHRVNEIARLREVICDAYLETGEYKVTPDMINGYLLQFAIKARR
jgi:hypothetical protein